MTERTGERRASPEVLDWRVTLMEQAVRDIGSALKGIDGTLQTLSTLEVRHTETREAMQRAFTAIKDATDSIKALDARIDLIEKALPMIQETSRWVRSGVLAVVGLVAVAVFKFVFAT